MLPYLLVSPDYVEYREKKLSEMFHAVLRSEVVHNDAYTDDDLCVIPTPGVCGFSVLYLPTPAV